MTERNPRRAAQLIETARLELANYANGGIDQLTPPTELGKIFRYSDSYTKTIFGRSGLNTERILAQEAREQLPFPESSELAWMIGYLSSSSTARVTSNNSSYINIAESVPEREHKLVELSEKLFNVTPHHYKRLK